MSASVTHGGHKKVLLSLTLALVVHMTVLFMKSCLYSPPQLRHSGSPAVLAHCVLMESRTHQTRVGLSLSAVAEVLNGVVLGVVLDMWGF